MRGVRKLVLEGKSLIKTFRVGDGSIEVLSKADIALGGSFVHEHTG